MSGLTLTCCECGEPTAVTHDGRCGMCFYVWTGGDRGEDSWYVLRAEVDGCNVRVSFNAGGGQ